VLLGTTNGDVYAYDVTSGEQVWRGSVGSEVLAPVAVGEGLVFVQTIDGSLVALESDTGVARWSYDSQVPILTLRGTSTPVFDGGVVYTGFANGTLVAVKAENGEPLWEHRVMLPEGRSELERMVDVDASPLVRGPLVYVVGYQGKVQGLRRADGGLLWEQDVSSYLNMDEGYSHLYVVDGDGVITAIDQNTAEVVWRQEALWRRGVGAPTAFSNYLAVADSDGYLHILAQSDGRMMGRRKLDGDGVRSQAIYRDGTLYVLGNSGSLQALEIQVR
jgi:outer membrane protein assembly factor BamB